MAPRRRLGAVWSHLHPRAVAVSGAGLAAAPTAGPEAGPGPGPLAGYRVLDLSQMLSGPMCCQILGDQGADVIKVEPLEGDLVRGMAKSMSPTFSVINRNKRSIALDLKRPEGHAIFGRLLGTADVVVQNFRPGAAERLGVSYDQVRAVRPGIVYLSISGFGESGPYADKRVYDPVIQAVSGLASIQADESGRPRMMRLIVPDKVTSVAAAQAVTAGLLQRARTGEGQHIRMSMLDAVMAFAWAEGMAAHTFVGGRAAGNDRKHAFYSRDLVYDVRDGFITVGTNTMKEWRALCAALNKPEWLEDRRFQDGAGLVSFRDARMDMVQEHLRSMTSAEALAVLDRHEVPCAPVHHPRERVLEDPQVLANGAVLEAVHPLAGRMRFARPAARFGRSGFEVRHHAPLIGEQTDDILSELGASAGEIGRLREMGVLRKEPGLH